jgi:hypothetical protein
MDTINVHGQEYDPYFILDVTPDDSDEHVMKAFKRKAKRYHPDKSPKNDKKKYELQFQIVCECFQYIKKKRSSHIGRKHNHLVKTTFEDELPNRYSNESEAKQTFDELNKKLSNMGLEEQGTLNEFGYGNKQRVLNIGDYDAFEVNILNQFENRKFSNEEFNKIFEYQKSKMTSDDKNKGLLHRSTDGFYGYNTADMGSCAAVSSYNGLLITGDDFGESGVGYWDGNYSDLKQSYGSVTNPHERIEVPTDFTFQGVEAMSQKEMNDKYKTFMHQYTSYTQVAGRSFRNEQDKLYQRTLEDLTKKQESDKKLVLKHIKQYDPSIIQQAMDRRLDSSPSLTDVLHNHYNERQIKDK